MTEQQHTRMPVCVLSHFSHVQLFSTLGTIVCQAPLSMGFSRQEYWSGLPFPSSGDLLDPGIKPGFPTLQADSVLSEAPGKQVLLTDNVDRYNIDTELVLGRARLAGCFLLTVQVVMTVCLCVMKDSRLHLGWGKDAGTKLVKRVYGMCMGGFTAE